jgi:hypothetical protein
MSNENAQLRPAMNIPASRMLSPTASRPLLQAFFMNRTRYLSNYRTDTSVGNSLARAAIAA